MTAVYDEIEIEDFDYEPTLQMYYYPCPCGDRFQISLVNLGEHVFETLTCL